MLHVHETHLQISAWSCVCGGQEESTQQSVRLVKRTSDKTADDRLTSEVSFDLFFL